MGWVGQFSAGLRRFVIANCDQKHAGFYWLGVTDRFCGPNYHRDYHYRVAEGTELFPAGVYMPNIIPAIALYVMWLYLFNPAVRLIESDPQLFPYTKQ